MTCINVAEFCTNQLTWKRLQYDWNGSFEKCCNFYLNNYELLFVKYLISNIFSKNLHLKFYWLLQFESQSKTLQQNFTTVSTWDSNRGFPIEVLVKVPAQDLIKLSPKLSVNENSSSGLKQRFPKWDLRESFSSKMN